MKSNRLKRLVYGALCALVLAVMIPVTALGQRRWVVARPHRSRVVVYNYQPRPYVAYQRRPYYGYQTYSYGSQPYYTNQNYSSSYSQPYFANRYAYSWANPTYRYNSGDSGYYRRYRNRSRVRIWLR